MRGRPTSSNRQFVDDYASVTISSGHVVKGNGSQFASFTVTARDGRKADHQIAVTTTKPHFGGVRYWYICPGCGCRVGKLIAAKDMQLLCRLCRGFAYEIQYCKGPLWAFIRPYARLSRRWNGIEPPGGRLEPPHYRFGVRFPFKIHSK
jgi:hypothetical protein